jgi:hypothetical protein
MITPSGSCLVLVLKQRYLFWNLMKMRAARDQADRPAASNQLSPDHEGNGLVKAMITSP